MAFKTTLWFRMFSWTSRCFHQTSCWNTLWNQLRQLQVWGSVVFSEGILADTATNSKDTTSCKRCVSAGTCAPYYQQREKSSVQSRRFEVNNWVSLWYQEASLLLDMHLFSTFQMPPGKMLLLQLFISLFYVIVFLFLFHPHKYKSNKRTRKSELKPEYRGTSFQQSVAQSAGAVECNKCTSWEGEAPPPRMSCMTQNNLMLRLQ